MESSSTLLDEAIKLVSSLDDKHKLNKNLSLEWCTRALNLLKRLHLQIPQFVENPEASKSWNTGSTSKSLEDYFEETLNTLFLCCFLKSKFSRMNCYRLAVDFAIKKLSTDGFWGSHGLGMIELEKLEKESKKLHSDDDEEKWRNMNIGNVRSGRSKTSSRSKDKSFRVIRCTMKMMSMLLRAIVSHPISVYSNEDKQFYREFPHLQLLSISAWKLHERLEAVKDSSRPFLCERMMVERAVLNVKEQMLSGVRADTEMAIKSIDQLRRHSEALKQSLEMFEAGVDGLFNEVLEGRKKALGIVRSHLR